MQIWGRRSAQLSFDDARIPRGRGGWRPRSGRPRGRKTCSHDARAHFSSRTPIHVTLHIVGDVPSLRRSEAVAIVHDCIRVSQRDDFRILELNTLAAHIRLLIEVDNDTALTDGMRSLGVRLARRLNRCFARRGALLAERYHARVLRTPREVRNVLRYVLLNARHHAAERGQRLARGWLDPASSAAWFDGWERPELIDRGAYWIAQLERVPRPTEPPRTWLCRVGWRKHGLLRVDDVPGATATDVSRPRPRVPVRC